MSRQTHRAELDSARLYFLQFLQGKTTQTCSPASELRLGTGAKAHKFKASSAKAKPQMGGHSSQPARQWPIQTEATLEHFQCQSPLKAPFSFFLVSEHTPPHGLSQSFPRQIHSLDLLLAAQNRGLGHFLPIYSAKISHLRRQVPSATHVPSG